MSDYNIVLYIGIGLIVFVWVLFLISIHFERQAEIKLFNKNKARVIKDNQFEINADGTETTKDSII